MAVLQRTCIGCFQVKAKRDLIRIVRSPVEKTFTVDLRGKEKGRGAYVCPNVDCIGKAMQPQRLGKAFRIAPDSADCINMQNIGELRQNLLKLVEGNHL